MCKRHRAVLATVLASILSLGWIGAGAVRAQEPELPPEAAGPSSAEIDAFAAEFGGPPSEFAPETLAPVVTHEEPGKVPESARQNATDAELVAVYCAYTRWHAGRFLAAMDAIGQELDPALAKVKELGVSVDAPDTARIKAQAESRIQAICSAPTVAAAEGLVADFESWGESSAKAPFDGLKETLQSKLQAQGDALRAKVKAEIDPYVASERSRIESELKTMAQNLAESKRSEFESSGEPPTSDELARVKSQLQAQVQAAANSKKAELTKQVQAKVDAILGDSESKFEAVRKAFDGIEGRISAATEAGAKSYDSYRDEAFRLRKTLVLSIVDKNLADRLPELDAAAEDLAEAKKDEPSVKTTDEIKAEIASDRKALESKLDAALAKGDETAFEGAMTEFRTKWEGYRAQAEKAIAGSVDRICSVAAEEFGKAKPQIQANTSRVDALLAECATDSSERCLKVNSLAARLGTLRAKMADLSLSMGTAEGMCAAKSTADARQLGALMRMIQADAEDLRAFGAALEADKETAIAGSGRSICDRALPQLEAARREIQSNDLSSLDSDYGRCSGSIPSSLADFCAAAKSASAERARIVTRSKDFVSKIDAIERRCAGPFDENALQKLSDDLNALRSAGEELRADAKTVRVQVESKLSEKVFCRAARGLLDDARSRVASALADARSGFARCEPAEAAASDACKALESRRGELGELESQTKAALQRVSAANATCAKAGDSPPGAEVVSAVTKLRDEAESLAKIGASLKATAETVTAGAGN